MLNVAYIGFGNSVVRYHLPYVKDKHNVKVKYIYRREEDRALDRERESYYPHIKFTSDIDVVMKDDEINLVVVNSPDDTHVYYSKLALENGKNVLIEKPLARNLQEAKGVFELAKEKGLIAMTNQNRRFDTDYLTTKKVVESGVLGEIIEVESHYDYFRPTTVGKHLGYLYGLGVHTIDQMIDLLGIPERLHYDVRSIKYPGESDDYFDIDFHYGRCKGIVKTSYAVKLSYPRFIVHGTKGSFIKYGGAHNSDNKDNTEPFIVSFDVESKDRWGKLSYVDDNGIEHNELVQSEVCNYGAIYDALYESIFNGKEKLIKDEEVLAALKIIEEATAARR